jgi:hypothetical protein
MKGVVLFFGLVVLTVNGSSAQSKAYVLQNCWTSTLNSFNPAPFFDQVFPLLQTRLKVKSIDKNPITLKMNVTEDELKEIIRNQAKENAEVAYYITLSSDLSLPLINLTRVIFKVPTRSSRFVCSINVYNNKAEKILGDTILNRGCIVKAASEDKIKNFYDDYTKFTEDMQCHFEAVKSRLLKIKD